MQDRSSAFAAPICRVARVGVQGQATEPETQVTGQVSPTILPARELSHNYLFGRQVFVGVIDADGDRVFAGLDRVGLELEGKLFGVE